MRPTTAPSARTSKSSSSHSPDGREADARLRISEDTRNFTSQRGGSDESSADTKWRVLPSGEVNRTIDDDFGQGIGRHLASPIPFGILVPLRRVAIKPTRIGAMH